MELELHLLHGEGKCPDTGHVDSRRQSHTSRVSKDARKVDMNTGAHSSWSKARRITAPATDINREHLEGMHHVSPETDRDD